VFETLLTSAEELVMTSGYYAIVHVNLGTWPATEGMFKEEYLFKRPDRTVLFVGHFPELQERRRRAVPLLNKLNATHDHGVQVFIYIGHSS
jgi:hypothetical protein